jgi:hypothetical protein
MSLSYTSKNFRAYCCKRCCTFSSVAHALKTLAASGLARVKQTSRRRRRYVMSSSSSSLSALSTEMTTSNSAMVVELLLGHIVEFGTSRIYSSRVHFGGGVGRALGAKRSLN